MSRPLRIELRVGRHSTSALVRRGGDVCGWAVAVNGDLGLVDNCRRALIRVRDYLRAIRQMEAK